MSHIETLIQEVAELKQIVQGMLPTKEPRHRWLSVDDFSKATGWSKDKIKGVVNRKEYQHLRRTRDGIGHQYDYQTWKQLFQ